MVARRLGLSERTLHRRLAEHGEAFQSIVTHSRRQAAEALVAGDRHTLAEVAFLTGFADQSAFQRAFTSRTGRMPLAFRTEAVRDRVQVRQLQVHSPHRPLLGQTGVMGVSEEPVDDQRIIRALILLQDYSSAVTRIAVESLVEGGGANRDIGLLLALHFGGPQGPSVLAETLGLDRSQASRMLRRLDTVGLVARDPDPTDGRRSTVRLTARGHRRIACFDQALGAYSVDAGPMIAEVLTLIGIEPSTGGSDPRSALEAAVQMSAAGEAFVERAVAALEPLGVGDDTGERFILGLLLARGPQRPGSLAGALGCSPAFASARLGRLEAAGLVTRQLEGGPDGRAVLVSLTPAGERAARTYLHVFAEEAPRIAVAVSGTLDAVTAAR